MPNPSKHDCSAGSCEPGAERSEEIKRIAPAFTHYCDSLTDEEVAEDRAWGEFALSQFPNEG